MEIDSRHHDAVTTHAGWVEAALGMLDEHHLVAWSRSMASRERFGIDLAMRLRAYPETETWSLAGAVIRDLETFCQQFEREMEESAAERGASAPPLARSIEGPGGIVERMRELPDDPGVHVKRRYYLWRDADVLLRHDTKLFSELVDAMAGVAAESEYASEDLLLIHRAAFIGSPALNTYAADPSGQFRSWLPPTGQTRGRPAHSLLWRRITGLESPPFAGLELI